MHKVILFIILFISCEAECLLAQETATNAASLYQAVDNYNHGRFKAALSSIQEAEKSMGEKNINVLYAKIMILHKIDSTTGEFQEDLRSSLDMFFVIVDTKNYPAVKFDEVTGISTSLNLELKEEKEQFEVAKSEGTVDAYNYFLSRYPNSKYAAEIKGLYGQLPFQKEQLQFEQSDKDWQVKSAIGLKKYHNKYPEMIGIGAAFIAGGAAVAGIGLQAWLQPAKTTTNTYKLDTRANVYLPVTSVTTHQNTVFCYGMLAGGGALFVSGMVLLPEGVHYLSKYVKLKKEAADRGIILSFYPSYTPGLKPVGANFALKF